MRGATRCALLEEALHPRAAEFPISVVMLDVEAARCGGGEFTLLLPRGPACSADGAAERLRAAIAAIRISSAPDLRVSASLGITAVAEPHAGVDGREMIGRADEALYAAKKAGRDRVCFLPGCRGGLRAPPLHSRTVAPLKIFVDADACPAAVKDIVIRAAERLAVSAIFVANKNIRLPASRHVSTARVAMGLDVADGYIVKSAQAGDLAITADIPLAAALVARGVVVLDLRGTVYTEENVGEALALRNFHHELREGGVATGGPSGFGAREAREFAGAFDRELSKALRRGTGERKA